MVIKGLLHQARQAADRSRRYSERHFKIFGLIALFVTPLSTFVERMVSDPAFETFYIRGIAALAGAALLFHERLPKIFRDNLDIVWITIATIILPFCFGALLMFNAALTDTAELPSIWIYQYIAAIFIFVQLVNHGRLSVALWIISILALWIMVSFLHAPNYEAIKAAWLYPLPVYLTVLLIGNFTNRNMHVVQAEQLRAVSALGSNIAHELRTPLASIRLLSRGIRNHLPALVDGYTKAKIAGFPLKPVNDRQVAELRVGLETVEGEVNYANTIINILLANTSEDPVRSSAFETFSISAAISEAVERYPFNNSDERASVSFCIRDDFTVHAPRMLIVHVLFNLIKNGVFFVQKARKGALTLSAHLNGKHNCVTIHDTGLGIPESVLPQIFERFFSTNYVAQGTGIGLSFCKMVMEGIGGEIQCESKEGEYTTFRLLFPPVN